MDLCPVVMGEGTIPGIYALWVRNRYDHMEVGARVTPGAVTESRVTTKWI